MVKEALLAAVTTIVLFGFRIADEVGFHVMDSSSFRNVARALRDNKGENLPVDVVTSNVAASEPDWMDVHHAPSGGFGGNIGEDMQKQKKVHRKTLFNFLL